MIQDNVVKLIQPAEFSDPLTEVLREGARALLAQREGLPVEQDRARHGLQAGPGRREELATARRSSPLAEGDPRYHVHQWDRGRQPRRSTRCRLTPPVTNFRQSLFSNARPLLTIR